MTTENYERHAHSAIFPIDKEAIRVIADMMKRVGYLKDQPITLYRGLDGNLGILDGFHRYEAAKLAGVEPVFIEFEGTDEEAFALIGTMNSARRNMTKSANAAAILAIYRQAGWAAAEGLSTKDIADRTGLKETTVNRLVQVGTDELKAIAKGEKSVSAATGQRKSPHEKPDLIGYTLLKGQAARVAALSVHLQIDVPRVLRRVFDAGIQTLDNEVASQQPSK